MKGTSSQYFKAVYVSSTQQQRGVGAIPVDLSCVDPASSTFMSNWDGKPAALAGGGGGGGGGAVTGAAAVASSSPMA